MSATLLLGLLFVAAAAGIGFLLTSRETAARRREESSPVMNIPVESRSAFIVCVFSMLGKLAEADGCVSPEEVARVESYIDFRLKLDGNTKALALKVFRDAASSPLELRDYAEKFRTTYPERFRLFDSMIEILVEVSVADGALSVREDELIRSAALLLGMSEPGYEGIKARHVRVEHVPQ